MILSNCFFSLEGLGDLLFDSLSSFFQSELSVSDVLSARGSFDNGLSLVSELVLGFVLLLFRSGGVLSDLFVDLSVELVNGVNTSLLQVGVPEVELLGVVVFSVILVDLHVVLDVETEDSVSVDLSVVRILFTVSGVSGVSLVGVGDVETTVAGTLQTTENSVTSGGGDQTNIEDSLEGLSLTFLNIAGDVVVSTIDLGGTLVQLVQASLVKESSGQQQTSAVASRVVGETSFKTESLKFSGLSFSKNSVTLDGGIDDLADNSGVGDSSNESVLGGVVLVLVLEDQSSSGIVVSLTLSSSSELGLESLEVSVSLVNLNESH